MGDYCFQRKWTISQEIWWLEILASKYPTPMPLSVEAFSKYGKMSNLMDINTTADTMKQVTKTIQGVEGLIRIDTLQMAILGPDVWFTNP